MYSGTFESVKGDGMLNFMKYWYLDMREFCTSTNLKW